MCAGRVRVRIGVVACVVMLTGCGSQPVATRTVTPAATTGQGRVMGGQQPVSGAVLQMYTVGTTGDGSAAGTLLPVTNPVTSDANGNFTITGKYSCANATDVYLVATGGNPGIVPTPAVPNPMNPNLALMTALGPCNSLTPATIITVNELTTVAAVVALEPYMTSIAAVGSGTSDLAGLQSAFTLAGELVNTSNGTAPGMGVPAGTAVPLNLLNTVADMLAACVNSSGGNANDGSNCGTLFGLTTLANPALTPLTPATPVTPADTITAMLNLAIDPSVGTAGLLKLVTADAPFTPTLTTLPPNLRMRVHPTLGFGAASLANGYLAFGDSNTSGVDPTPYVPPYPKLVESLYPVGGTFADNGVGGSRCLEMNQLMFAALNPQDSGNPVVSDMIGTNDAVDTNNAPGRQYFMQCQFAHNARAAISASNTVLAGGAGTTQTGTWTADNTYAPMPGLTSTTNGSCVQANVSAPQGVVYLFYGVEYLTGSGGTFTVSVDGSVATDTITNSSTLYTTLQTGLGGYGLVAHYVGGARFVTGTGSHEVAACVTSATGSSNDVRIYALAVPPLTPPGGATGPQVFVGGVMHLQNDPNDVTQPGTGYGNAVSQQVATTLAADGLNASFVDVRSYVDPYLGMLSSPEDGCGVSGNPGLHANDCGIKDLAQAFADAMGLIR